MQCFKKELHYKIVSWDFLEGGWVKINTDGASRGNAGPSSNGFCLRDCQGDIINVEADNIGYKTNLMAKATVVLRALQFVSLHNYQNILLESD